MFENVGIGSTIETVTVTDIRSLSRSIEFAITSGNADRLFAINRNSGVITVSGTLDHEARVSHAFAVTAFDSGTNPVSQQSASVTVLVVVSDVNDNAPIFSQPSYTGLISENIPAGVSIVSVLATDQDSEPFATVSYSLLDTPGVSLFELNSSTGELSTLGLLDFEAQQSYSLTVVASDSGSPSLSSTAQIVIQVRDMNDVRPVFDQTSYFLAVSEAVSVGFTVLQLEAIDPDTSNVTYTLIEGNDDRNFQLSSMSGVITVARNLDYEETQQYVLTITANDGVENLLASGTASVLISVLDENDNMPVFSEAQYLASIDENLPAFSFVLTVFANDTDSGNNSLISYSITLINSATSPFEIDENGVLYTLVPLDYEIQSSYELVVTASDEGVPTLSSSVSVTVSVFDLNDNVPTFVMDSIAVNLTESIQIGSIVATFEATDADSGSNADIEYRFEMQNDNVPFSISATSGVVSVTQMLDYETSIDYEIRVIAFDLGIPSLTSTATLSIQVIDVNDNAPVFSLNEYAVSVSELHVIGTSVLQVQATDIDSGVNSLVTYQILAGTQDRTFSINANTGLITLAMEVNFEEQSEYIFTVSASNSEADNPLRTSVIVRITVLEVNEHTPAFTQDLYVASVFENQPAGSNVTVVEATDADGSLSGVLTYELTSGNDRGLFEITNNGEIRTLAPLDREQQDTYELNVTVIDSGIPSLSSSTIVRVTVLDLNDSPPQFPFTTPYLAFLSENAALGTNIMTTPPLSVSDADAVGPNSELSFSIVSGDPDGDFMINRLTGQLQSTGSIDFERVNHYELSIMAVDNGSPQLSSTATVIVEIVDQNDNQPQIVDVPTEVLFQEGQTQILVASNLSIFDADSLPLRRITIILTGSEVQIGQIGTISVSNPPPSVTVSSPSNEEVMIEISGSITPADATSLLRTLTFRNTDLEPDPSSRFVDIVVLDGDTASRARVEIAIELVNDNPPVLDLDTGTSGSGYDVIFIEEGSPVFVTGSVSISDSDSGATGITSVTVELVGAPDGPSERLIIASTSVDSIDVEFGPNNHSITLSATFQASFMEFESLLSSLMYVNIEDEPQEPLTRTIQFTASDSELNSQPANTTVTIVLRNDPPTLNLGGNNDYQVEFVEGGGAVVITSSTDFVLTDSDNSQLQNASVTLTNPVDGNNEMLTLSVPIPDSLSTIVSTHSIAFEGPAPLAEFVAVLQAVSYDNTLLSPADELRQVEFTVSDGVAVSIATSFVTFSLVNDPPILDLNGPQQGLDFSTEFIEGSQAIPITSEQVAVRDVDSPLLRSATIQLLTILDVASEMLTLTPTGQSSVTITVSPNLIRIDGLASLSVYESILRQIRYSNSAEEPNAGTRTIQFVLSDGGQNSTVVETTVLVLQINDVPELVLNGGVTYEAVYVEEAPPISIVNSSNIVLQDNDNTSLALLLVVLQNIQDGESELLGFSGAQSLLAVRENRFEDQEVRYMFSFSQRESSIENFRQLISSLTYQHLSPEPTSGVRDVSIFINDGLESSTPQRSTVRIVLLNDNAPVFQQFIYQSLVAENTVNVSIVTIQAEDDDSGMGDFAAQGTVRYSIIAGNEDGFFVIDPQSGEISIVMAKDRETNTVNPVLTVQAFNPVPLDNLFAFYPFSSVIIAVLDVNDNSPQFIDQPYLFQVTEHSEIGHTVGSVLAMDADVGSNADIQYSITGGNLNFVFTINPFSGVINVANSNLLDREEVSNYLLSVTATDGGSPATSNTTIVSIEILDINDNPPSFSATSFATSISEFTPTNTTVLTVEASDLDLGLGGQISYSLEGNETFTIDSTSGEVRTLTTFNREQQSVYEYIVVATDGGSPNMSSSTRVRVTILDENDNPPVFQQSSYSTAVLETTPVDQPVLIVTATDADVGSNSAISYSINGSVPFEINTQFGTITVSDPLDRETQDSYIFEVIAEDAGSPVLQSSVSVAITILDVNDNPPEFDDVRYEGSILENDPLLTSVLTVQAFDSDVGSNGQIEYSIVSGGPFSIDALTGEVVTVTSIDRELQDYYLVEVVASDGGDPSLSGRAMLAINVSDINDNSPVFERSEYEFVVTENTPAGEFGSVFASDLDVGHNSDVEYSLFSDVGGALPFSVNSVSGLLFTLVELDREDVPSYDFIVVATDRGAPVLSSNVSVYVRVLDQNDNAPRFSEPSYFISLPESFPTTTSLVTVMATDDDLGSNAEVRVSLVLTDASSMFTLDPLSGELFLTESLDAEVSSFYVLTVQAQDAGLPQQTSISDIQIAVMDVNDNPIELVSENRAVSYVEEAPAIFIAPGITVQDADISDTVVNATVEIIPVQQCCEDQLILATPFLELSAEFFNNNQLLIVDGPANTSTFTLILQSVQYINTNPEPRAKSLTFRFTVSDGVHTTSIDIDIAVVTINDHSPLVLLDGTSTNASATFIEDNPGELIVPDATVTDEDSDASMLSFVEISIQIPADATQEFLTAQGSNLVSVLPPSGGVTLRLSGPASFQEFVSVLSSLRYHNTAADPQVPLQRVVEVFANDGDLTGESSFATVQIVPVNDPPVLRLSTNINFTITFEEQGDPVRLVSLDFQLSDPDSEELVSASVTILDVVDTSSEYILIEDQLPSSLVSTRVTNNQVQLLGPASLLDFSAALMRFTYLNNATNPSPGGQRTVQFIVSDGELNSTAFAIVQVQVFNDPPIVDLNGVLPGFDFSTTFTESGPPVSIVPSSTIVDTDNTKLVSMTVRILPSSDGVNEILTPSVTSASITSMFDPFSGVLQLTGVAVIQEYVNVLRSVRYQNTADEPTGASRRLEIIVSDGELNSQSAFVTVSFNLVNDPPVVQLDSGGSYSTFYLENSPPVPIANERTAQITDVDNPTLVYLLVQLTNLLDGQLETMNYTDPVNGLIVDISFNPETLTAVYNFSYPSPMVVQVYTNLLLSLSYNNLADEPDDSQTRLLTVLVSDGEQMSQSVTSQITIRLVDDNQPQFLQSVYNFEIEEGSTTGTPLGSVEAVDLDIGDVFLYQLASPGEPFSINSSSGEISVAGVLDRENQATFELIFQLTRPTPPFSVFDNLATVLVTILDVNDNQPTFNQSGFMFEISENASIGMSVGVLEATDGDSGSNAELRYSLTGTSDFDIDSLTGVLSILRELDRESISSYQFTTSVRDNGQPSLSSDVVVMVTVLDVNDISPQFLQSSYFTQVVETTPTGSSLLQLSARDGDIGTNAQLLFSLAPGTPLFVLDPQTGILSTSGTLTPNTFSFTATVRDSGTPQLTSTASVSIEVINLNSTLPVFSQPSYVGTVIENSPSGTSILTISALDPLVNEPVIFGLVESSSSTRFSLDATTGVLRTSGSVGLDRETQDVYQLQVNASSSDGERTAIAQVVVNILDANDFPPVFGQSAYNFQVAENSIIGTLVGGVFALDSQDIGSNAVITGFTSSTANFTVSSSGIVFTNVPLDRENIDTYTFQVIATDGGTPALSGNTEVTVTVLDENDEPPVFSQNVYQGQVAEREPSGTSVLTVASTDADVGTNSRVSYSTNSTDFAVDAQSGVVSTAAELDYESQMDINYEVYIFASDGVHTSVAMAIIMLLDVDDTPPMFTMSNYFASVSEEQIVTSVLQVEAVDVDSGPEHPISYSIVRGDPDSLFNINSTGVLSVVTPLDREAASVYVLSVQASNLDDFGNVLSSIVTVTIDVQDINDNSPLFIGQPYQFSVSEASLGGEMIGTLVASDDDMGSNANVSDFTIIGGDSERIFQLNSNSGVLQLAPSSVMPLDREMIDRYQLVVQVSDRGSPPLVGTANVTIIVEDVNDIAPVFSSQSYSISIREDTAPSATIFAAVASDGDLGTNAEISFSLLVPSIVFDINSTTGRVTLLSSLDFETQATYFLTLIAVDGGNPSLSSSASLEINVVDADDQDVQFTPTMYTAGVFENSMFGTPVLTVVAQDPDSGNPITYSLDQAQEQENPFDRLPFSIDSQSGAISVAGLLDRESIAEYMFFVFASNTPGTSATATVTIEILDTNDVVPSFPNGPFQFQVLESATVSIVLGQLTAIDTDLEAAGTIVAYDLIGVESTDFTIASASGVLSVMNSLDYESTQMYSFNVTAIDGGSPSLTGTAEVVVEVMDVNDNPPIFDQDVFNRSVLENATIGTVILTAVAVDFDSGVNAQFNYSLSPPETQFSIDPQTGEISVASTLALQTYSIIIVASDAGSPPLSSNTTLIITVTDVNEAPTFSETVYSVDVAENHAVGSLVTFVLATDPDEGSNAVIQYFIQPEDIFAVNNTGAVTLLQPLDFEEQQSYVQILTAVDAGSPSLTAFSTLLVTVLDVNDNAPVFSQSMFTASVSEDSDVGTTVLFTFAADFDSLSNAAVTYTLLEDGNEGLFAVNSLTGAIFTLRALDFEHVQQVNLVVQARDGGQPVQSTSVPVVISIIDVNDNDPVFDQSVYQASVREDFSIGNIVLVVQANDSDTGFNAAVSYMLTNASQLPFDIVPETGEIFIVFPGLDREVVDQYIFEVEAFNPFFSQFITTATVIVTVADANDNQPVFDPSSLTYSISEAAPIDTVIGFISALDNDIGSNALLVYTIEPASELVSIANETGVLTVAGELDFEVENVVELTVVARDSGTPQQSTAATLMVMLEDANDIAPIISVSPSQFTFQEESIPITVGTGINIIDPDTFPFTGATVKLYLGSGTTQPPFTDFIQLDRAFSESQGLSLSASTTTINITGTALLNTYQAVLSRLEFGSTASEPISGTRQIRIQLFDGEFNSNEAVISVGIQLLNDNPPVLDLSASRDGLGFQTTFTEGGSFVFITAQDVSLVDLDGDDIDSISVNLTNSFDGSLERISALQFGRVSVDTTDFGIVLTGPATSDEFELVLMTASYENLADEPSETRTPRIIEFVANDGMMISQPAVASVIIQLVNDAPRIALGGNALDVMHTYAEAAPSLSISSTVSDPDSDILSFVNVTVLDFQPGVDQLLTNTQDTNITAAFLSGTLLLSGPASSEDFNTVLQNITYVNSFVTNVQDNQLLGGRRIEFSVSDGSRTSQIATAFVSFTAVNDPPLVDLNGPDPGRDYTVSFSEGDSAVPIVSSQLSVTDVDSPSLQSATVVLTNVLDQFSETIFTSVTQAGISSSFIVSAGILRLTGPASVDDFQRVLRSIVYQNSASEPTEGTRVVSIIVNDGEANSVPVTSNIIVSNVNDPPELVLVPNGLPFVEAAGSIRLIAPDGVTLSDVDSQTLASLEVIIQNALDSTQELISTAAFLGDLQVRTIPAGQAVRYLFSFSSTSLGTIDNFASLIEGLSYNNVAPEPLQGTRDISITVSDGQDVSTARRLSLRIQLVNDNLPSFAEVSPMVTIFEDAVVGEVVYNSSATDVDTDSILTYTLIGDSSDFEISSESGSVTLASSLDRETQAIHSVTIQVSDGLNAAQQILTIVVEDVNDNMPLFSANLSTATIDESAVIGSDLAQVIATDQDAGSNAELRYTITDGNQEMVFTIDENNGTIVTSGSLDYERTVMYRLVVTAQDLGTPKLTGTIFVLITVADVNDNPPMFAPDVATVQGREDTPVQTLLYSARAFDIDNMQLSYSIANGSQALFSINATTGDIFLENELDYEQETTHVLVVEATDGLSVASLELTIEVLDVDDNPLVFVQDAYTVSLPENASIGVDVLDGQLPLQVIDLDVGLNAVIQFTIEAGDPQGLFSVNPVSSDIAQLILAGALDRETESEYFLTILARHLNPSQNDTAFISVFVEDINDSPPVFSSSVYRFSVPENSNANTLVGSVTATDADIGVNSESIYSILSGDSNNHFLITGTGDILVSAQILDRENISQYTIQVVATNVEAPMPSTVTSIVITITDVNDNPPEFIQPFVSLPLCENTPPGQLVALQATDPDALSNGEIVYSVHPDNATLFVVEPVTGVLSARTPFNFETDSLEYLVIVFATDGGSPALSSQAQVTVTLIDMDEFIPDFEADTYTFEVIENTTAFSSIASVTALDMDGGTTGLVEYKFLNVTGPFNLDNQTGEIYTSAPLDRESVESYQFSVQAFNPFGTPGLSSTAVVSILVLDINDNAPLFTEQEYTAAIITNVAAMTSILSVSASDPDLGSNGEVRYSLADPSGQFNISETTGTISSVSQLQSTGTYNMVVTASDLGTPSLSSSVTVVINVIQPLQIDYQQEGAGFILEQTSPTRQEFGFFVNTPPGSTGTISASLSDVTVQSMYSTELPEATQMKGVVLNEEVWHDQAEVRVVVQVSDDIGDVHCAEVRVAIRLVPDSMLRALADGEPQVSKLQLQL